MKMYAALLKAVLINDIRQLIYHPKRKNYSNIASHLIFPIFISFTISLSLFQTAELYYYSFFILTFSMLITTMTLLIEFSNRIIRPDDLEIWLPHPVNPQTLFYVKLGQIGIYILLLSGLTSLVPSLLISFDARANFMFGFQLWLSVLFANALLALLLTVFYIVIGHLSSKQKSRHIVVIFQIVIALMLVGLHQWGARISQETSWQLFLASHPFLKFLPSVWINELLGWSSGFWKLHFVHSPTILLFAFIALLGITTCLMPSIFFALLQKQPAGSKTNKSTSHWIRIWLSFPFFSSEFKSGAWMMWYLLKRDRTILIPMLPPLTFPLIILFFRLYDGHSIQFFSNLYMPEFQDSFFPYLMTSIFFTLFLIHNSLQYSKDHKAFWILQKSLGKHPEQFCQGIRWIVFTHIILPVIVILYLFYGLILSFPLNIIHGLILTSMAVFGMVYFNFIFPLLPFSRHRQSRKNLLPSLIAAIIPLLVFEYLFFKLIHIKQGYILYILLLLLITSFGLELGGSLRIRKKVLQKMRGFNA